MGLLEKRAIKNHLIRKSEKVKHEEVYEKDTYPLLYHHIGNMKMGSIIHLYGRANVGKTALASSIFAWYSWFGYKCLWIDSGFYHPSRYLTFSSPNENNCYITQNRDINDIALMSELYNLIIIDDTLFLKDQHEIYKITDTCRQNNCTLILLSQVRAVIGSPSKNMTPAIGINSADILINMKRHEKVKDHICKWVVLNKIMTTRNYCFEFDSSIEIDQHGVDIGLFIIRTALQYKVLNRNGAFVFKDKINIGSVRNAGTALTNNPKQLRKLWTLIKDKMNRDIPLRSE